MTVMTDRAAAIRPFRVEVSPADVDDLRRRLAATRWPEKETVSDFSQGVPLATMQKLVKYWSSEVRLRAGRGSPERTTPVRH